MTEAQPTIIYASVMTTKTVRIALMIASLNDLEVYSSDIFNAYLQAFVPEKDARKTAVIVRALYDLKSAGATFRSHLARCMESLGYISYKANLIYG